MPFHFLFRKSSLTQNDVNATVSTPTIVGLKPLKVLHGLMGASKTLKNQCSKSIQKQLDFYEEMMKRHTDTASRIAFFELIRNDEMDVHLFASRAEKGIEFIESFGLKDLTDMKNGGIVGGSESRHNYRNYAFQSEGLWWPNIGSDGHYFLNRELPSSVTPLIVGIQVWTFEKPVRVKILARRKTHKSEEMGEGKDDEAVRLRDSTANVRGAEASLKTDEQENEWMTMLDKDGLEWEDNEWKFWRVTNSNLSFG